MNWQDQIDKHHKGQTGFFKEMENKQKQEKMNTLKTFTTEIKGEKFTLEFNAVTGGQYPKILLFVNGIEWCAVNSCNFKKDFQFQLNYFIQELLFGAYKMFINK